MILKYFSTSVVLFPVCSMFGGLKVLADPRRAPHRLIAARRTIKRPHSPRARSAGVPKKENAWTDAHHATRNRRIARQFESADIALAAACRSESNYLEWRYAPQCRGALSESRKASAVHSLFLWRGWTFRNIEDGSNGTDRFQ